MGAPVSQDGRWVVGATATSTVTFVRPNNATQYAAGQVISDSTGVATILQFRNMARFPGGGGIIQSAVLIDSVASATKPDTELYLFDQIFPTQADAATWTPLLSSLLTFVGVIPFPVGAFKTGSANGIIDVTGIGMAFTCAPGSTTLYGILVARNAYTPTALEQFELRLQVLQD